jgi:16S rRNA (guanine966-N2)-methyltransferase
MKNKPSAPPQEVRLLGGLWKRSKLPVADRPGLRPTPSRVRETLFNWLGQDLTGARCLDAFAGTGALGFEAASRGAREVLMVEQDPALVAQLQSVRTRLKAEAVRVQRGDALAALRAAAGQGWDVVFLDPPFDATALFEPALRAARAAVAAEGFIYLEAPSALSEDSLAALGLALHRHGRAGAVAFQLLRPLAA